MITDDPLKFAEALRAPPLDLSASYASELANGRKKPSLDLALSIERILGVPPRFWADESVLPEPGAERGAGELVQDTTEGVSHV